MLRKIKDRDISSTSGSLLKKKRMSYYSVDSSGNSSLKDLRSFTSSDSGGVIDLDKDYIENEYLIARERIFQAKKVDSICTNCLLSITCNFSNLNSKWHAIFI